MKKCLYIFATLFLLVITSLPLPAAIADTQPPATPIELMLYVSLLNKSHSLPPSYLTIEYTNQYGVSMRAGSPPSIVYVQDKGTPQKFTVMVHDEPVCNISLVFGESPQIKVNNLPHIKYSCNANSAGFFDLNKKSYLLKLHVETK